MTRDFVPTPLVQLSRSENQKRDHHATRLHSHVRPVRTDRHPAVHRFVRRTTGLAPAIVHLGSGHARDRVDPELVLTNDGVYVTFEVQSRTNRYVQARGNDEHGLFIETTGDAIDLL